MSAILFRPGNESWLFSNHKEHQPSDNWQLIHLIDSHVGAASSLIPGQLVRVIETGHPTNLSMCHWWIHQGQFASQEAR